jgi:hypothetical protein
VSSFGATAPMLIRDLYAKNRIITNAGPSDSCGEIFRSMQNVTLYSQDMYSLLSFTINNKHVFLQTVKFNNIIHKTTCTLL